MLETGINIIVWPSLQYCTMSAFGGDALQRKAMSHKSSFIIIDNYFYIFPHKVVNYSACGSVEEICEKSSKLVTLIDLAGHHKYLKTTIFGLTGNCPDFAMLVVSANTGIGKKLKKKFFLFLLPRKQ